MGWGVLVVSVWSDGGAGFSERVGEEREKDFPRERESKVGMYDRYDR